MSAWDDYLAAARELSALRAEDARRDRERDAWVTSRRDELNELGARVHKQRTTLEEVSTYVKMPLRIPVQQAPQIAGTDVDEAMRAARDDVQATTALMVETDYLAHRSPLLPRWRTDERNAVVYGFFALLGLLVQMGVIVNAAAQEDTLSGRGWVTFTCFIVPFAAFACGWLAIGVLCRPRLMAGGKLPRNPRLGLIVCLSTWLIVCQFGGRFLF